MLGLCLLYSYLKSEILILICYIYIYSCYIWRDIYCKFKPYIIFTLQKSKSFTFLKAECFKHSHVTYYNKKFFLTC
jgi:hypothetical protein